MPTMTDTLSGCGCACHAGTGYNACSHCLVPAVPSVALDFEALRTERGWPTPISMRHAADALDMLVYPRYGDILRWIADACDAHPNEPSIEAETRAAAPSVPAVALDVGALREAMDAVIAAEDLGVLDLSLVTEAVATEYARLAEGTER